MKKVTWGEAKIKSAKRAPGTYGSFQELFQKAEGLRKEQEEALEFLKKAMPAMVALLEIKLKNQEPLIVMRPLRYQTSALNTEESDGFYKSTSSGNPKFTDVVKTIMPGTQLVLKSLDMGLHEFVFIDALNREHCLSFSERDNLLTQTNIFEEVKSFLNGRGE